MAIIRVRNDDGVIIDIPAFVGPKGDPGADYVLTEADKAEIAELAAELVEVPGGGNGADGFSPIAAVEQTAAGAVITITDKDGTTTATVTNGKDGEDGYTPQKGVDYFDGVNGQDGSPGKDGSDGVSPTVAVSKSGKVTTVSITDKNGTKTATINDGADGTPGKTPVKGTDYWTPADQEAIVQQVSQNIGVETMPDYVKTEAMSVLDKVVSAQGSRTFVLGAITDMHYGSSDYIDGVIHACQGMTHIAERIKLDAVAVLGDYTDEHQMDTETAVTDLEEMNALLDGFASKTVNLRVKGNHDHRPNAAAQTYRYIMANSDDVVWGSRIGGYFYRDFAAYKLRAICLDTTEVARDNLSVSDEQYNFFVNALDMSAKEDAEEWGVLILSHHPLDWNVTSGAYRFGNILNAYQTGGSWTDGTISCNYTDKNSAVIVGNIHGHIHNLLTDKIYIGEAGNSEQTSVYRMCVPASRVDYPNHYSGVWKESTTYGKTQNTAEDTSFNIICIDLDSYTIKAICYGAGYDRDLTYHEKAQEIVNIIDTVGYTDDARYSASSHGTKAATGYVCTGEIQLAPGDVLRTSGVNFDAADQQYCNVACIPNNNPTSDWTLVTNSGSIGDGGIYLTIAIDTANNLTITGGPATADIKIRLTGYGKGADLIVTVNEEIT